MKLAREVCVLGVGMTRFYKPGEKDYPELALEAGRQALADAGVAYDQIQQAYVGYVYGESTSGQRAVYQLGITGIPVYNVNNNCSTGSTALFLAYQAIGSGASDCVLALGFEKMEKGSLGMKWGDRTMPLDKHMIQMNAMQGFGPAPGAAQMFGGAGREHMEKYGTTRAQLAKVSVKNRRHAVDNERSQFRQAMSLEEILGAPMIFDPLTKFQCCPTTDGAAAAIVCSRDFARRLGVADPVRISAMAMATDLPSSFEERPEARSMIKVVGQDMTRKAAREVYADTGWGPDAVQAIELHDCFTANELLTYEGLELCGEGEAGRLIDEDQTTYGGRWVVNPSGGLLSKGHPLGATGLAQCFELTEQLRGRGGSRQVPGARRALQHNLGLGGACVVAAYEV
jgi:sterol carrier protein 2